ncbi:MAG: radical SAM protein [Actinobacteria bacterium]|nr:radical SAM protein [Actinomycetota bacterium]
MPHPAPADSPLADAEPDPRAVPLPSAIQVEVTAACNLRCRMCLVRYRDPVDRVHGSLGLDRFRALLDGLHGLRRVTLQGLGEPLLCPDLAAMVREASARGIDAGFNTNATLLTRARARELVDAGVAWIHVSLDGADAATYEAIRDGARFSKVIANLAGLAEVVGQHGRAGPDARPEVSVVFVAQRSNVATLPDLVELVARIGVLDVHVQNLSHDFGDTAGAPLADEEAYVAIRSYTDGEALWAAPDRRAAEAAFAEATRRAGRLGVRLRLPTLDPADGAAGAAAGGRGCSWPWESACVTRTGAVQPCCMVMGEERAVLGRVGEGLVFEEIWNGSSYREFRRALASERPPDVCAGCSLYRKVF